MRTPEKNSLVSIVAQFLCTFKVVMVCTHISPWTDKPPVSFNRSKTLQSMEQTRITAHENPSSQDIEAGRKFPDNLFSNPWASIWVRLHPEHAGYYWRDDLTSWCARFPDVACDWRAHQGVSDGMSFYGVCPSMFGSITIRYLESVRSVYNWMQ